MSGAINEYFEVHFGKHWGVIIFVGAATVAHTGFVVYLHRRYRELAAKYQILTAECDFLRGFITNIDARLLAINQPATTPLNSNVIPPPQYSTLQQNSIKTSPHPIASSSAPVKWSQSISRVASSATSESDYTDAIDEMLPPNNSTLLDSSTNSAASASELLETPRAVKPTNTDDKIQAKSVEKPRKIAYGGTSNFSKNCLGRRTRHRVGIVSQTANSKKKQNS